MGGERSSAVRQRLSGKICALCRAPLPPPHVPGEQTCEDCGAKRKPPHRIYMHFQTQSGWYCQFLEEDLKTPLGQKLHLNSEQKLLETAERGGYVLNLEGRQALQQAIDIGRGGVWLTLTEEQYRRLKGT